MFGGLGKGSFRVGLTALSVTLLAGVLVPLPLDAAAPSKPVEVEPLGVKGKAPEPIDT